MSCLPVTLFVCYFFSLFFFFFFFFFNDTATTEIYTLSLHDALPISGRRAGSACMVISYRAGNSCPNKCARFTLRCGDRKSTRLNSSHRCISYAVFCLKKKKKKKEKKNIYTNIDR